MKFDDQIESDKWLLSEIVRIERERHQRPQFIEPTFYFPCDTVREFRPFSKTVDQPMPPMIRRDEHEDNIVPFWLGVAGLMAAGAAAWVLCGWLVKVML